MQVTQEMILMIMKLVSVQLVFDKHDEDDCEDEADEEHLHV